MSAMPRRAGSTNGMKRVPASVISSAPTGRALMPAPTHEFIFTLIARTIRAAERGGYAMESMAVTTVVRVVERYLADHRDVFVASDRRRDLLDCLDAFVRAGWPAAQTLTFRIADIWR
jgi:hypothetical protein